MVMRRFPYELTNTETQDVEATVAQIQRLANRRRYRQVSVLPEAAEAFKGIKQLVQPLVATSISIIRSLCAWPPRR